MSRNYFYLKDEGTGADCSDCGPDATVNDGGLICSNPDCPNS